MMLVHSTRVARMLTLALAAAAVLTGALTVGRAATPEASLSVPGRASANVSLAASGAFVAATWSAASPAGDTDIFAAVSRDAGRTFSSPVRVNSTPGDARVNGEQPPRVALQNGSGAAPAVTVVWTTKGKAGTSLVWAKSGDGGRTFSASALVPGTDAPGNRGWEGLGLGPGGRMFSVWLDHRKLAAPQQTQMNAEHHHESSASAPPPAAAGAPKDGVAMAQLSQLYVASLDGAVAPVAVTGGVCYCCKTAIVAGQGNALYLAWRHVYAGNMRDIAFAMSTDGGRTFSGPVRVSEDKWQIEGCPDDGPSMVAAPNGVVHVVWPSVVTGPGGPVKALFHASTRDGRTFTARERIPTEGQANHPQLAIDASGTLAVTWDESGSGTRTLGAAVGVADATGRVRFTRQAEARVTGTYPVIAATAAGTWLRAWTSGPPASSSIVVAPFAASR